MQRTLYSLILLAICFAVGCGGNVTITGTAALADGTPVATGFVEFHSGTNMYRATNRNGSFSPGATRDGGGIPAGVYQIRVSGVGEIVERPGSTPEEPLTTFVSHINERYEDIATSGLSIDTSQTRRLELVLDPR